MKKNNYKLLTGILAAILACVTVASAQTSTWNVASGNWSNPFELEPHRRSQRLQSQRHFIFARQPNPDGSPLRNVDISQALPWRWDAALAAAASQTGGILTIPNGSALKRGRSVHE